MDWVHFACCVNVRARWMDPACCSLVRNSFYERVLARVLVHLFAVARRDLEHASAFQEFHSAMLRMDLPHLGMVYTREALCQVGVAMGVQVSHAAG